MSPSSTDSNPAPPKLTKRACDCCRKRKVKCDSTHPCAPCKKASLCCAYDEAPKKKGPKGLRSAKVLHLLRGKDEAVPVYWHPQMSPPTMSSSDAIRQQSQAQLGAQYREPLQQEQNQQHMPHLHPPPVQVYYQQHLPQPIIQPVHYASDSAASQTWSEITQLTSPHSSEASSPRVPGPYFLPYMNFFFEQMFVIMPVVNPDIYKDQNFYVDSAAWSIEEYCFICAISAAVIVQLQIKDDLPPYPPPPKGKDDLFAEECLRERKEFRYVRHGTTLSVMTSFFLFAYYGNHEDHDEAWIYLQETIALLENLDMDHEETYDKFGHEEQQWRRRLYWLLFITERAYAIQRRKHARLPKTITQPQPMDSEKPDILDGFNMLGRLFATIDDNFVCAWQGSKKHSACNEAWLTQMQGQLDTVVFIQGGFGETQQLDIAITKEWLHVLAWQMGLPHGLVKQGKEVMNYPIELARRVVDLTSRARGSSLDSHGIGMEQKLRDIATCLADVLRCTTARKAETHWQQGQWCLAKITNQLHSIRGQQSRYLEPLLSKMAGFMNTDVMRTQMLLPPPRHELPTNTEVLQRHLSEMKKEQSMCGGLNFMHPAGARGTFDYGDAAVFGTGTGLNVAFDGAAFGAGGGRLSPGLSVVDSMDLLRGMSMNGHLRTAAHGLDGAFVGDSRMDHGYVEEQDDGDEHASHDMTYGWGMHSANGVHMHSMHVT